MANTSSFYGNLEGNATSADKINHTLTIVDKVFDGSANVEISRISIANGGTGATTAEDALVNLNALSNANGAVGTANIANDAITADKLGNGSVNSLAIAEQAVTASKIGTDVTYSTIGLVSDQVRGIYIGTETPSNTLGNNGDIYIKYAI